jgi:hypothetical protein
VESAVLETASCALLNWLRYGYATFRVARSCGGTTGTAVGSSVARLTQPRLSVSGERSGRHQLRPVREHGRGWRSGPASCSQHLLFVPTFCGVTGPSPSRPFLSICASRLPVDPLNVSRCRHPAQPGYNGIQRPR